MVPSHLDLALRAAVAQRPRWRGVTSALMGRFVGTAGNAKGSKRPSLW